MARHSNTGYIIFAWHDVEISGEKIIRLAKIVKKISNKYKIQIVFESDFMPDQLKRFIDLFAPIN